MRSASSDPETRLAAYGTLAPGRSNAHELAGLEGTWVTGTVRGHLFNEAWGAAAGYPGIRISDSAPEVQVQLFTSPDLAQHWARLDEFEGPGYERVAITVDTAAGPVLAYIYALRDD